MKEGYSIGDLVYFKEKGSTDIYEIIYVSNKEKFEYGEYIHEIKYTVIDLLTNTTINNVQHSEVSIVENEDEFWEKLLINEFEKIMELKVDNGKLLEEDTGITPISEPEVVVLNEKDTIDSLLDDMNIINSKKVLPGYSEEDLQLFDIQLEIIHDKLNLLRENKEV